MNKKINIKYGYCKCGCGNRTKLCTRNNKRIGIVIGNPRDYLLGHCPRKNPDVSNEKNPMWKGNNVGYNCLHKWISRKLGKPKVCWSCGNDKATWYEWANISGKYKRDLKDYIRLCRSCHRYFDYKSTARGEKNASSKLINKDIINIRKEYIPYKNSFPKLAKKYNVCHQTIQNILYGITWKHI